MCCSLQVNFNSAVMSVSIALVAFLIYNSFKYNSLVLRFLASQKFNAAFLKSVLDIMKGSLFCF